jgi:hypothetical protein
MARPGKRRRGGNRAAGDRWERWQLLATAARFVVELLDLLRNQLTGGGGPGRLT